MISLILSGQPYRQPGSPTRSTATVTPAIRDALSESRDTDHIVLALNTLGKFDFSNHVLNEFVRDCIITYLEDDHPEVRKSAALTTFQLFVRDPICNQTSNHAIKVVGEVL